VGRGQLYTPSQLGTTEPGSAVLGESATGTEEGALQTLEKTMIQYAGPTCKRLANRSTRCRRGRDTGERAQRVSVTFLAHGGGGLRF
jgi:hypothetical protein